MRWNLFLHGGAICLFAALSFVEKEVAQAAVVYSQASPAQPIGAFTSTDRLDYPKAADNFLLNASQPTTIRSVRFIGGYTATMPPPVTPPLDALPADNFRIVFLEDAGGRPGAPIVGGDFSIGTSALRVPTNGSLLNGIDNPIAYSLNIPSGITLSANTAYWISVLNDPGPSFGWAWARASGVYDQFTAGTEGDVSVGPWITATAGGMFFAFDDSTVPEPTSDTIFVVSVISLVGTRKSRHRQTSGRI